jgi:hypothetical protein
MSTRIEIGTGILDGYDAQPLDWKTALGQRNPRTTPYQCRQTKGCAHAAE